MRNRWTLTPLGLPGLLGLFGLLGLLGLTALGCDASNPVAPIGGGGTPAPATEFVITVTAESLTVFVGGSTMITVSAVRADNNEPPTDPPKVSVSTSLGNFAGEQLTTFGLDSEGKGSVELTAGDETGTADLLARLGDSTASLSVEIAAAPVASFTWEADGLEVTFTDTSEETPDSWAWTFGDGETSGQRHPVHPYEEAGTYDVELEVGYGPGVRSSFAQPVEVAELPDALFTWETSGLAVKFTDESTGGPSEWTWDFGDGGTSDKQNPGHTYEEAGTFVVGLEVKNAAGSSHRAEFLDVAEAPVAAFTTSRDRLVVLFTDASTGSPTAWEWNFGDESDKESAQDVRHDYGSTKGAGTYAVSLTVTSQNGKDTDTVRCFVCVNASAGDMTCPATTSCPPASP